MWALTSPLRLPGMEPDSSVSQPLIWSLYQLSYAWSNTDVAIQKMVLNDLEKNCKLLRINLFPINTIHDTVRCKWAADFNETIVAEIRVTSMFTSELVSSYIALYTVLVVAVTKTSFPPNKTDEWALTFPRLCTFYRTVCKSNGPIGKHGFTTRLHIRNTPSSRDDKTAPRIRTNTFPGA
jgi:hypothetical protein